MVARVMAIDYGTKRTGLAVTDPLQIVPVGLDTVPTEKIFEFLQQYLSEEAVETIVVGEPFYPDGQPSQIHHLVVGFARKLRELFPEVEVVMHDEQFTSEEAKAVIQQSGARKKKRRDKSLVDKVSAVLILKDYLESRGEWSKD
jgi:putative Holliday junction resolvase